jgi:hypothetical protein
MGGLVYARGQRGRVRRAEPWATASNTGANAGLVCGKGTKTKAKASKAGLVFAAKGANGYGGRGGPEGRALGSCIQPMVPDKRNLF